MKTDQTLNPDCQHRRRLLNYAILDAQLTLMLYQDKIKTKGATEALTLLVKDYRKIIFELYGIKHKGKNWTNKGPV